MPPAHPHPAPPAEPAWDIAFTRLTRAAQPRIEACALELARRFHALGLGSDLQCRQTPRGLATFLAVVGQRGLVCIVELTLVDGMAVRQGPCVTPDVRLLDGCGDVVEAGLAAGAPGLTSFGPEPPQAPTSDPLDRVVTAVYVAAMAHFDLLRPDPTRAA